MDDAIEVVPSNHAGIVLVNFKLACISDAETIAGARLQTIDYISKNKPEKVIFDFSEVKFFSSQLLGLLIEARAKLTDKTGVVISAIDPQLHRVFKITSLDKIFRFYPDKNSAINDLVSQRDGKPADI